MRLKNQNYVNGKLLLKNVAVDYVEPIAEDVKEGRYYAEPPKEIEPPVVKPKRAKKAKEDK